MHESDAPSIYSPLHLPLQLFYLSSSLHYGDEPLKVFSIKERKGIQEKEQKENFVGLGSLESQLVSFSI